MKSHLKSIVTVPGEKPKSGIDRLVTATGIARRLVKGYYDGKFKPSVIDALKIAKALNMPVERIWQL